MANGVPADELPAEGSRAHELLLAVVAAIRAEGRVDLSLRQLAALSKVAR